MFFLSCFLLMLYCLLSKKKKIKVKTHPRNLLYSNVTCHHMDDYERGCIILSYIKSIQRQSFPLDCCSKFKCHNWLDILDAFLSFWISLIFIHNMSVQMLLQFICYWWKYIDSWVRRTVSLLKYTIIWVCYVIDLKIWRKK